MSRTVIAMRTTGAPGWWDLVLLAEVLLLALALGGLGADLLEVLLEGHAQ